MTVEIVNMEMQTKLLLKPRLLLKLKQLLKLKLWLKPRLQLMPKLLRRPKLQQRLKLLLMLKLLLKLVQLLKQKLLQMQRLLLMQRPLLTQKLQNRKLQPNHHTNQPHLYTNLHQLLTGQLQLYTGLWHPRLFTNLLQLQLSSRQLPPTKLLHHTLSQAMLIFLLSMTGNMLWKMTIPAMTLELRKAVMDTLLMASTMSHSLMDVSRQSPMLLMVELAMFQWLSMQEKLNILQNPLHHIQPKRKLYDNECNAIFQPTMISGLAKYSQSAIK